MQTRKMKFEAGINLHSKVELWWTFQRKIWDDSNCLSTSRFPGVLFAYEYSGKVSQISKVHISSKLLPSSSRRSRRETTPKKAQCDQISKVLKTIFHSISLSLPLSPWLSNAQKLHNQASFIGNFSEQEISTNFWDKRTAVNGLHSVYYTRYATEIQLLNVQLWTNPSIAIDRFKQFNPSKLANEPAKWEKFKTREFFSDNFENDERAVP